MKKIFLINYTKQVRKAPVVKKGDKVPGMHFNPLGT